MAYPGAPWQVLGLAVRTEDMEQACSSAVRGQAVVYTDHMHSREGTGRSLEEALARLAWPWKARFEGMALPDS